MKKINLDTLLNIETNGIDETKEDFHHNRYEATPYKILDRLIESNYIHKDNTVLDFGCGKGRVSFYLNYKIGCCTKGVDYNENLIEIANKNKKNSNFTNVHFFYSKAESFSITNEDCFYFFNPFSEQILRSVISNILASYYENPRKLLLFFYYPEEDCISYLMGIDELLCIDEIDCYDLYEKHDDKEVILVFEII